MESDGMDFIAPAEAAGGVTDEISAPPPEQPARDESGRAFSLFAGLKAAPFAVYLFGWVFCSATIVQWVLTILLSAVDFWFSKNVAGRLILGMQWANSVNADGENELTFEYFRTAAGASDRSRAFWTILYGSVAAWALFCFFSLIKFNFGWVIVVAINLTLSLSNAWGFRKCSQAVRGAADAPERDFFRQQFLPFLASQAKESFLP